jgi:hypothetical protein
MLPSFRESRRPFSLSVDTPVDTKRLCCHRSERTAESRASPVQDTEIPLLVNDSATSVIYSAAFIRP